MTFSILVATAENGVIGRDGDLPWRLPADLERFKALTMGHHLIMGRKTWDSIGRPLPGRTSVVVSRTSPQLPEEVVVVNSVDRALKVARRAGDEEPFVVGGAEIYRQVMDSASRLYLTRVHAEVEGDTFFPELDESEWRLVERLEHPADVRNEYPFSFLTFERN
ncbi:MAG: dihydrofolate reductase [Acidobacteriota bacterium]